AAEDLKRLGLQLDGAGGQLRVLLAGKALADLSLDGEDVLAAQLLAGGEDLPVLGLEDDLGDAVAVAEVDEDLLIVGPVGVDPAVEDDGLSDVGFAQLAAGVRPPWKVGHVESSLLEDTVPSPRDRGKEACWEL